MYCDKDTKKINSNKLYSIGYNSKLKKYVLAQVIPWVSWYEQYFEITEEEYNMFGTNELDDLADSFIKLGIKSERFLFSMLKNENTEEQLKTKEKAKYD